MNEFIRGSLGMLLDVSLKSLLLAILAGAGLFVFRVRSSTARHRVWAIVLMGMIAMPLLALFAPGVSLPIHSIARTTPPAVAPAADIASEPSPPIQMRPVSAVQTNISATRTKNVQPPPKAEKPVASFASISHEAPQAKDFWPLAITTAYLIGFALLLVRFVTAMFLACRLVTTAEPVSLAPAHAEIVGGTSVCRSDRLRVPVTAGLLRPTILLPADCGDWSDGMMTTVLTHEQAHVRRRDAWFAALAELNRAMYWFHPLAWFLRRRLTTLAEQSCDDAVIQSLDNRTDYARQLVEFAARLLGEPHRLKPAAVAMAATPRLEHRIDAILDDRRPLSKPLSPTRAVILLLLAAPILLLTAGLHAADPKAAQAPAYTDEPEPRVVKGALVKASDGSPVAGAHVTLRIGGLYWDATSDTSGDFRFTKIRAYDNPYEVWAYHENLVSPRATVEQVAGTKGNAAEFVPLHLSLAEGKQAKFIVTSKATGRPLAGARVWIEYPEHRKILTDQNGVVLAAGLMPNEYDVTVYADGYARAKPGVDLANPQLVTEYHVAMEPGGVVTGIVVDEAGKPLRNVGVYYRVGSMLNNGESGAGYGTDRNGRFRYRYLPLNLPIKVEFNKEKYLDQSTSLTLSAVKRQVDLRIVLSRRSKGGSVAGTVTDEKGQPIAGARVANYGDSSEANAETKTDAKGRFKLDDLIAESFGLERVTIAVSAKGFAPQSIPINPGTAAHPMDVAVKLQPGHSIRGRVIDEDGKPVAGAYFMLRGPSYPMGSDFSGTHQTDADGKFSIDSLPADVQFSLSTPTGIYIHDTHLKVDGTEPVVFHVPSPGLIRGIVDDGETGKPVTDFRLRLNYCSQREPGNPTDVGSISNQWYAGKAFHTKDGRFTIERLANREPVALTVTADGYEPNSVPRVVARKPADVTDVRVILLPVKQSDMVKLSGRLLDYKNRGVSGAQVRLIVSSKPSKGPDDNEFNWELIRLDQSTQMASCEQYVPLETDQDGRFEYSKILPGRYVQLAYWGDGIPKGRWYARGKSESGTAISAIVHVPQPATVRGTIDRTKLRNATTVELSFEHRAEGVIEQQLEVNQSTFEFHDVPAGPCWIRVGGRPVVSSINGTPIFSRPTVTSQKLELTAGETKIVNLEKPDDSATDGQTPTVPVPPPGHGPNKPGAQSVAELKAEQKKADAAAQDWLKLLDAAKYADCWDSAAKYLQNAVGKDDFAKELKAARGPLGKMVSRKLKVAKFLTALPGAPDGKYVVIQYDTEFEDKKSAVETITPMEEKDGTWKVSGYFIK